MTALGMARPGEDAALKEAIRQNIGDLQLTPAQLDVLIQVFEYVSQNPGDYKNLLQKMIEGDALDEGDMPEEYDPEFIGAMLAVLQEMRQMQGAGAQEPMDMSPVVQGLQPVGMASGGLADVGQYLAAKGRGGDSILAHITPQEAAMLKRRGGSGTINPATGLPEFKGGVVGGIVGGIKNVVKSVVNVTKDVLKSPVGRVLTTVALAAVLGPAAAGFGMSLSAPAIYGLASAGSSLLGGGDVKDALISGAMGYIGGGGDFGGLGSPLKGLSGYLPGAAGSALNTGLTTGLLGAGIGRLGGMSEQDALRMGLISGVSSGAMRGLQNNYDNRVQLDNPSSLEQASNRPAPEGFGATDTARNMVKVAGAGDPTATAADMVRASNSNISLTPDQIAASDAAAFPNNSVVSGQGSLTNLNTLSPEQIAASDAAAFPNNSVVEGQGSLTDLDLKPSYLDKAVSGTKSLYNEYLSPSRAGLAADAGIFTKYGPLAAVGTGAAYLAGGMESEPDNPNPAFDRNYTGTDYIKDNPDKFKGGLSTYTKPTTPDSPIVPTPSYGSIPIGQPGNVIPTGITGSPSGVAQPYNMSGLYGVPLIYGPDGQLRRMAKGGDAKMTNFPRRQGPINGPGTGTSDDIPAMLSDGEFVFTARAVRNAGGGSRRKGAARMYKLMKKLEGGAVKGK
jgi:hypothetical protein